MQTPGSELLSTKASRRELPAAGLEWGSTSLGLGVSNLLVSISKPFKTFQKTGWFLRYLEIAHHEKVSRQAFAGSVGVLFLEVQASNCKWIRYFNPLIRYNNPLQSQQHRFRILSPAARPDHFEMKPGAIDPAVPSDDTPIGNTIQ